jgi:hypothetical protein
MEDNDLLDDSITLKDQSILDMIQWWEKRRLIYNLIVGLVGLFAAFVIISKPNPTSFFEILWFPALPYALFANTAYLAGWVLELLLRYYFKITLTVSSRQTLLWLGIAISIAPLLLVILLLF